jgi:hypothetical protein
MCYVTPANVYGPPHTNHITIDISANPAASDSEVTVNTACSIMIDRGSLGPCYSYPLPHPQNISELPPSVRVRSYCSYLHLGITITSFSALPPPRRRAPPPKAPGASHRSLARTRASRRSVSGVHTPAVGRSGIASLLFLRLWCGLALSLSYTVISYPIVYVPLSRRDSRPEESSKRSE